MTKAGAFQKKFNKNCKKIQKEKKTNFSFWVPFLPNSRWCIPQKNSKQLVKKFKKLNFKKKKSFQPHFKPNWVRICYKREKKFRFGCCFYPIQARAFPKKFKKKIVNKFKKLEKHHSGFIFIQTEPGKAKQRKKNSIPGTNSTRPRLENSQKKIVKKFKKIK